MGDAQVAVVVPHCILVRFVVQIVILTNRDVALPHIDSVAQHLITRHAARQDTPSVAVPIAAQQGRTVVETDDVVAQEVVTVSHWVNLYYQLHQSLNSELHYALQISILNLYDFPE